MDSPEDPVYFATVMPGPRSDPPGWVDGAPTSGVGQSCAFCGSRDVVWVHRLARDRRTFRFAGETYTLSTFWALCDRCETIYSSGDEDSAVEVMRTSPKWEDEDDVAELVRKRLATFREADLGPRRLDPEPPGLVEARKQGFVPLQEVTGAGDTLGRLWPAEHRLWLDELGPGPVEDEYGEVLDCWLVRSPWPSLSVEQTLEVLWRWVERAPFPSEDEAWTARVLEVFGWSDSEAVAFANSEPEG